MTTLTVESLKTVHRSTWAAGDYAAIAELIDEVPPPHLIERAGVAAEHRTLDVATGTGNVALRAAKLTPDVTAAELVRVCKPGGVIGLCNWTPEGAIGELFAIMSRYLPPPPAYASSPPLWGSEEHVGALFGEHDIELEFERATTPFRFDSAEHWVSFFETNYGPMLKARERLSAEGSWEDCRDALVQMMERRNESVNGGLVVPSEYLLVVARKRG